MNKQDIVDEAIKKIRKQFGQGAILEMGKITIPEIEVISSGSMLLDNALGIGGFPKGRIIEIFGPESSGKTTLALAAIAEGQKDDGIVAFIDAEHALDVNYAKKIGVNVDRLLLSQPSSGEEALEITEGLVRSGVISLIVIDSVAALVPQVELDGEMTDQTIGVQARLMSKALRKLTSIISTTDTIVIFINQLREKIGVIFGSPEITTGGRALKFYSSVRLEIRKREMIKQGHEIVGQRSRIKVVKNKVAAPFSEVLININYNEGIDKIAELVDIAVEQNIIQKAGS